MQIKLNPLNSKVNSDDSIGINLLEFWKYYYQFLNIKDHILSNGEIEFLAAFSVKNDIEYVIEVTNLLKPNYYGMIKKLVNKGFITKIDNSYKLHLSIQKLKDYLETNHSDVIFNFPFQIRYDT